MGSFTFFIWHGMEGCGCRGSPVPATFWGRPAPLHCAGAFGKCGPAGCHPCDRFFELLSSQFTYEVTKAYFDDAAALVRGEVPSQCERFGLPLSLGQWEYDITAINRFLRTRVGNMIDRFGDFFTAEDNNTNIELLYPNPVSDDLHLILWSDGFTVNDIELFDLMGRKLYSQKIVLMEGENYLNLSCPFASGIYILRFGNKTQKIVIQ